MHLTHARKVSLPVIVKNMRAPLVGTSARPRRAGSLETGQMSILCTSQNALMLSARSARSKPRRSGTHKFDSGCSRAAGPDRSVAPRLPDVLLDRFLRRRAPRRVTAEGCGMDHRRIVDHPPAASSPRPRRDVLTNSDGEVKHSVRFMASAFWSASTRSLREANIPQGMGA